MCNEGPSSTTSVDCTTLRITGVLISFCCTTEAHINMANSQMNKTTEMMSTEEMQVKLVFHGPGGRKVEVRRFEVDGKPTIATIKDKVAELRPLMAVFTIGWRDEDGDMVIVETEEELRIAIKQAAGGLLSIHVMEKMVEGEVERVRAGQRSMIRMPEEYKVQVKELERRLAEQERGVSGCVLSKEEMIAVVKKQSGILFARGIAVAGENSEAGENVWRIMEAKRVLEIANGDEVALLFIPTKRDENEVVETQMTGNWKETEGPTIVAFKRRGWGEEEGRKERGPNDQEQRRRGGDEEEGGRKRLRGQGLGKRDGMRMGSMMPRRKAKMLAGGILERIHAHI